MCRPLLDSLVNVLPLHLQLTSHRIPHMFRDLRYFDQFSCENTYAEDAASPLRSSLLVGDGCVSVFSLSVPA